MSQPTGKDKDESGCFDRNVSWVDLWRRRRQYCFLINDFNSFSLQSQAFWREDRSFAHVPGLDFDLHHHERPLFNSTKTPTSSLSKSGGTDTFKMAAGTHVPCDGQINRIRTERKQYRIKQCLNTWTEPLWAGRFLHVTFHLEPGESSSDLKGQNRVSSFNSSATSNEESLFCRQKPGSIFTATDVTLTHVHYRSSWSNLCRAIQ